MVIYDLVCSMGHCFEGWFPNFDSFEAQKGQGLLSCSVCGSTQVEKRPSGGHVRVDKAPVKTASVEVAGESEKTMNVDPGVVLKAMHHYIKTHFKDVGGEFAQKALAMHRGESPQEPVYGTTTPTEREMLETEGVDYTLLPKVPETLEN